MQSEVLKAAADIINLVVTWLGPMSVTGVPCTSEISVNYGLTSWTEDNEVEQTIKPFYESHINV